MTTPNINHSEEILGDARAPIKILFGTTSRLKWVVSSIALLCVLLKMPILHGQELQQLRGKFIEIVTDIPLDSDVQQWPLVVDAAIPIFCRFWQVDPQQVEGWQVKAFVMSAKEPFRRRGLIPEAVPDFPHGFQFGDQVFLLNQPSSYYTRHLLLHEVVHALAFHLFGGAGPPWFMEGTAEYLATHRWTGQSLQVGVIPDRKETFPYWGRFKMIDKRRNENQALSLMGVLRFNQGADRFVEPYAWTWAAMQLFNAYPEYRQHVIASGALGNDMSVEFTKRFYQSMGTDWQTAQSRWRVLIDDFNYGFDWTTNRLAIDLQNPYWNEQPSKLEVVASRGWQSTGLIFKGGTRLRIAATGTITLGQEPRPWISTPEGITFKYHRGLPIGKLIATWLPIDPGKQQTVDPLAIIEIDDGTILSTPVDSWLLLKVNENPAELSDNDGNYEVRLIP